MEIKKAAARKRATQLTRRQRIDAALARFRREFPKGDFGRHMTKEEEARILGYASSNRTARAASTTRIAAQSPDR
jgi:hypothetical protein